MSRKRQHSISLSNDLMLEEVRRLLSLGNKVEIMTKGNSMLPFIKGGIDSVRLVRKDACTGDAVLALTNNGNWVLHRLVKVENGIATLHGDGNLRGTEQCREEDIAGVVEAVIGPHGKERKATSHSRAARWNRLPYMARRVVIALYNRIILPIYRRTI